MSADLSTLPTPDPAPSPGLQLEPFGRYQLVRKIGEGGMAEVWKAVSTGVQGWRRVSVIKRIHPDKAHEPSFVELFCDEARVCALLNHPNLVQVHEFGAIDGTHFLAMEYLAGKDLAAVMRALRRRGQQVPWATAAHVALGVARGLSYAHALRDENDVPLNIVHRDVSPSNVMLLYTGGVKLIDFGIARVDEETRAVTQGRWLKGKTSHMSPEQARGEPLDGRSDVFSLGVVLWEMLTTTPLFRGDTDVESLRNIVCKPIPAPSSLAPDVPPALDRIVLTALDRTTETRYQSAAHLARDLEAVLRSMPDQTEGISALLDELFDAPPLGDSLPAGLAALVPTPAGAERAPAADDSPDEAATVGAADLTGDVENGPTLYDPTRAALQPDVVSPPAAPVPEPPAAPVALTAEPPQPPALAPPVSVETHTRAYEMPRPVWLTAPTASLLMGESPAPPRRLRRWATHTVVAALPLAALALAFAAASGHFVGAPLRSLWSSPAAPTPATAPPAITNDVVIEPQIAPAEPAPPIAAEPEVLADDTAVPALAPAVGVSVTAARVQRLPRPRLIKSTFTAARSAAVTRPHRPLNPKAAPWRWSEPPLHVDPFSL